MRGMPVDGLLDWLGPFSDAGAKAARAGEAEPPEPVCSVSVRNSGRQ